MSGLEVVMSRFRYELYEEDTKERVCCVVDQFCKNPANGHFNTVLKTCCFKCGMNVCTHCSSKRKYLKRGIKRLCNDCQRELDGNSNRVFARIKRMAGA